MVDSLRQSKKNVFPAFGRVCLTLAFAVVAVGFLMPRGAEAAQVSSRSDALADSRPSASSNHTFSFKVNNAIYGSSTSGSSTLSFAFPPDFTVPTSIDCGDVDAATSSQFNFNYPACQPTTTAWGSSVTNGISFVQVNAGHCSTTCNSTSIPFLSSNSAGNLVVVAAIWDSDGGLSTVTDTLGNVYASALGPVNWRSDGSQRSQIFYARNIRGGANTVTVTPNASTSLLEVFVHEYRNADATSPLDVVSSATSLSGTAMDSGSAATHFANELIFGVGFAGAVDFAGTGFTERSTFQANLTEDKSVTTVGSYKADATSAGGDWIMMMATFKAAQSITLTPPTDATMHVATGTVVTIKIGSNATNGQQGDSWITNPATAGTYTISVGGTFGGSGNMLVKILAGVTVEARVAEHLSVAIRGVPNWYNAAWGYRERITIDRAKVSGSATSFPVLVNTTDPDWRHTAWGGHMGSVTGFDFVFTDRDGLTKLDHEIEKYASTTGEFVSWVRVPFLSSTSNTILYAYYGNASAADQQNVTGVWNSTYQGVWHLTTTSTNTTLTLDSTVNSNTGTKLTATEPANATGQIDGAQDFDGTNDRVSMGDINAIDGVSQLTYSAWVRPTSLATLKQAFGKWSTAGFTGTTMHTGNAGGQGADDVLVAVTTNGLQYGETTGNILANGVWGYWVMVFDGTLSGDENRLKFYFNGVQQTLAFNQPIPVTAPDTAYDVRLGAGSDDDRYLNAVLDEARILNVAATSTWIAAEYNNQSSPNTFYDLGAEEAQAQIACSADDGATVSVVNTTETSVDFGNISPNAFYQGCQDIEVSTNAGGGYVATVREDSSLRTGSGATIPDTSCDAGCDEITGGTWVNPANVGFGHTCRNQTGSDCNLEYADGTKFRRFPSVVGGTAGLGMKVATGSFTGNGTARTISHGLGVTPKVLMLWLDEDAEDAGWVLRTNQHGTASSIQFPTESGSSRLAADMITAMDSTTFSLGTASSVNQTSSSYMWVAYAGNGVGTGTYDGNGVDNRDIPHGLGITPKIALIFNDKNAQATGFCVRTERYVGDISHCWQTSTFSTLRAANFIQGMDGTNFQVGTNAAVNEAGDQFKWFALAGPSVQTGSYTGDSVNGRAIPHSLSTTPAAAFVWNDQTALVQGLTVRTNQYVGDTSISFEAGSNKTQRIAGMIQTMSSTSFQVGTSSRVNIASNPYQWFAVKTSSAQSEAAGETIMASSTPVSIAVGRVKYRLAIPSNQAAGVYTTRITYIITPRY